VVEGLAFFHSFATLELDSGSSVQGQTVHHSYLGADSTSASAQHFLFPGSAHSLAMLVDAGTVVRQLEICYAGRVQQNSFDFQPHSYQDASSLTVEVAAVYQLVEHSEGRCPHASVAVVGNAECLTTARAEVYLDLLFVNLVSEVLQRSGWHSDASVLHSVGSVQRG